MIGSTLFLHLPRFALDASSHQVRAAAPKGYIFFDKGSRKRGRKERENRIGTLTILGDCCLRRKPCNMPPRPPLLRTRSMRVTRSIATLIAAVFAACLQAASPAIAKQEPVIEKFQSGQTRLRYTIDEQKRKQGTYKEYHPNGQTPRPPVRRGGPAGPRGSRKIKFPISDNSLPRPWPPRPPGQSKSPCPARAIRRSPEPPCPSVPCPRVAFLFAEESD